jgi:hypothetical protein
MMLITRCDGISPLPLLLTLTLSPKGRGDSLVRSYRLNSIFISFSPLGEKEQSGAVLWTELYFHFFLFLGEEGTVWGAYRLSALSSWGRGNSLGRSYRLNAIGFSPFPLGEKKQPGAVL